MDKIKYKGSINKEHLTDASITDDMKSYTLKAECVNNTIKSSMTQYGNINLDNNKREPDNRPVMPDIHIDADYDKNLNSCAVKDTGNELGEVNCENNYGKYNIQEDIQGYAQYDKTDVTDSRYKYTSVKKEANKYYNNRREKGIKKYLDANVGRQNDSVKQGRGNAVAGKRVGNKPVKPTGSRESLKTKSPAVFAGENKKNKTVLLNGTSVISKAGLRNKNFMKGIVQFGEPVEAAFGEAGDAAADAPHIHSIKTDFIRKSMEGPLYTVMNFVKGLFCKLIPGRFILKAVIASAAALILAFMLIVVAIFEATPIGRIIAFKNNIVSLFSGSDSDGIINTAEQALDNKFEEFETNSGIREKEYIMADDSDYDCFRDSSGRVSNYGSVLGLYYCLLYDKTAGKGTDYNTVDSKLIDRAFHELTSYSNIRDEHLVSPASPKDMLKLGEYSIEFMEDAAASEISVYLPDVFYNTYSFSKGNSSNLLVDIVSRDGKYPFKIQKCGIKKGKGLEGSVAVVYPAHMKEDVYNSFFPGRTDGMWTTGPGIELWLNTQSQCELKKSGKEIVAVTLKSFKSDYTFVNESTYYMAKAVLSELGEPMAGEPSAPEDGAHDSIKDKKVKKVIEYAFSKKGHPYSQALRNDGYHYDCSSFVYACYLNGCGLKIEHGGNTAAAEAMYCTVNNKEVGRTYRSDILKPGDLIFYSMGTNGRYLNITHVALYCGNNMVIDASYSVGKVVYRKIYSTDKIVLIGRPL